MSTEPGVDVFPSILELPRGIHLAYPDELYHAKILGMASKSMLDLVHKSPAHYKAAFDQPAPTNTGDACDDDLEPEPPAQTRALFFGKAFHAALLEPAIFASRYATAPSFGDCRKTDHTTSEAAKENKKRRDDWRAQHEGRELLTIKEGHAIRGMIEKVRAHRLASRVLDDGTHEITMRWRDPSTSLECRARADHWSERLGTVLDLKTTGDARGESFVRSVEDYRYDAQQAFYSDALAELGANVRRFLFLACEKTPPYECALFALEPESVARGRDDIRHDLRTLAACLERDAWPGYDQSIQRITMRPWVNRKGANR